MEGLSLIIITRNRCAELVKTIELISEQKCNFPYEVIIVDQASTDKTQKEFEDIRKPFRYIRLEKNYGVSGGRNRGAGLAKYNNMVFLDDDAHFVKKDGMMRIADIMNESRMNLFAFHIYNLEGGLYNWPYGLKKAKHADDDFQCGTFIGCGHGIKKDFFNKVGGYSEALFFWGEESELVMKSIAFNGEAVQYCGDVQIVHRVMGNGRNTYDAQRFYYQVRNRMYLYRELIPCYAFFYKLYYEFGYYLKAKRNGWIKEYKKGMTDYKKMQLYNVKKLTLRQLIRYIKF